MSELDDEVSVINSIYPDCMTEWASSIYDIQIPDSPVILRLSFPGAYPDKPPTLMAVVKGNTSLKHKFNGLIDKLFVPGQVIVYDYIEACRDLGHEAEPIMLVDSLNDNSTAHPNTSGSSPSQISWIESQPVTDRKSLFIARVAEVRSPQEALDKITLLKTDKKIAKATHNITAYRIKREDGITMQDCDDDGEDAAGGRLMHLLTLTDSWNVVVCVSRWYGGIKLGPDRFKHINSTARDALLQGGFIASKSVSKKH